MDRDYINSLDTNGKDATIPQPDTDSIYTLLPGLRCYWAHPMLFNDNVDLGCYPLVGKSRNDHVAERAYSSAAGYQEGEVRAVEVHGTSLLPNFPSDES